MTEAQAVTGPRRWSALAALAALVVSGLLVVAFAPDDTAGSDIAGDALYAAAVYATVVLIAPRLRPVAVAAIAAGWCIAVELFQLTGIPLAAGAAFAPAMPRAALARCPAAQSLPLDIIADYLMRLGAT